MTILKETLLALLQLMFWTACFVAVLWSLTNAYVFLVVTVLVGVFFWVGIYG